MVRNYSEFIAELSKAGFSGAVFGKDDGVFSLFQYGWGAEEENELSWFSSDPEHDPWEWRMRVLEERNDISFSKVFFRKAGYITKEWYPYFLAVRRKGLSFQEAYEDGLYSHYAKRIYETLRKGGPLPVDRIKLNGSFRREDKSKFDRALTDLQMGLYITMCGRHRKLSKTGEEYGWASTMFCTAEEFWLPEVFEKAALISVKEAEDAITGRILQLSANANIKKIRKFIYGL